MNVCTWTESTYHILKIMKIITSFFYTFILNYSSLTN